MAKHLLDLAIDAESENVQLSAVNSALDRAGLKPSNEVVLSQGKAYDEILEDLEFGTMTRAESRRARGVEELQPEPLGHNESGLSDCRDCHADSAMSEQGERDRAYPAAPTADDGPSAAQPPRARPKRAREARSAPHIQGEDAIRIANQVNAAIGALRALPPGHGA
jgi:hypothetical protein